MDDTLLGANPAQLAVGDQVAPGLAPVSGELVKVLTNDERGKKGDGSADNLIAATDGEGLEFGIALDVLRIYERMGHDAFATYHAVTLVVRVCVDDAVGGGVVTSGIHGIRASLVERGLVKRVSNSPSEIAA